MAICCSFSKEYMRDFKQRLIDEMGIENFLRVYVYKRKPSNEELLEYYRSGIIRKP